MKKGRIYIWGQSIQVLGQYRNHALQMKPNHSKNLHSNVFLLFQFIEK